MIGGACHVGDRGDGCWIWLVRGEVMMQIERDGLQIMTAHSSHSLYRFCQDIPAKHVQRMARNEQAVCH